MDYAASTLPLLCHGKLCGVGVMEWAMMSHREGIYACDSWVTEGTGAAGWRSAALGGRAGQGRAEQGRAGQGRAVMAAIRLIKGSRGKELGGDTSGTWVKSTLGLVKSWASEGTWKSLGIARNIMAWERPTYCQRDLAKWRDTRVVKDAEPL